MCQFCNQPDYITCNCQPLEPLCDQCADNSDCYPGRDLACEVYHFDNTRPSRLRNLRLPNGTTGQEFVEAVEAYINSINTPFIGVDSPSIITSTAGIKGHVVRMDVALSSASGNTLVIEDDGLHTDDFSEGFVKINEFDNAPGYLGDKLSGGTDVLNIITINVVNIDGLLHLSPSTNVEALTSTILNEGDFISSLITTLLNNPTFFDKLLSEMINNSLFMEALVSTLFNNPTFIENFTSILRDNPSFFLGFFDIIGNNPDLLAAFCELLANCPNCFCNNQLTVESLDCEAATYDGDFVVGTASSGTITIPIVITGEGILNVTVTVTGDAFSGAAALILDESSTEIVVPINYNGVGGAGTYPLTVSFTGATEPVDDCLVNVEVTSVPTPPTLNLFGRVPLTGNQMQLQVQVTGGDSELVTINSFADNIPAFEGLWASNFASGPNPAVNPSFGTLTQESATLTITPYRYNLPGLSFILQTYINNVLVSSETAVHATPIIKTYTAPEMAAITKLEFVTTF